MPDHITVICDGSEYQVTRNQVKPGPSSSGSVWVIRSHGFYIGTFDLPDASEDEVRNTACEVIRHGSTSVYPLPGTPTP